MVPRPPYGTNVGYVPKVGVSLKRLENHMFLHCFWHGTISWYQCVGSRIGGQNPSHGVLRGVSAAQTAARPQALAQGPAGREHFLKSPWALSQNGNAGSESWTLGGGTRKWRQPKTVEKHMVCGRFWADPKFGYRGPLTRFSKVPIPGVQKAKNPCPLLSPAGPTLGPRFG